MEIFRIRLNSNKFQSFLPADQAVWQTEMFKMDCQPRLDAWKAPGVYISNPKHQAGNFSHLCSGGIVCDSVATGELRDVLEMAGELLPFTHQESPFFLLNVLACVNCLDDEKTKWVTGKTTGAKIRIQEYHFHRERLSESTLFKIPETASGEILCVEGLKDPGDEFKARVEAGNLTGIQFEKIWSDK
jgi:hypothetical protein